MEKNEIDICPSCRRADVQFTRNVALQRMANDLDVQCKSCNQAYKHVESHGDWCPSAKVKCLLSILGCGWEGQRKFLEAHLKEKHAPSCPLKGCGAALEKVHVGDGSFCDVCQQSIATALVGVICNKCDYVECPGCFVHRPIKSLASGCSIGKRLDVMDASAEEETA